MKSTELKKELQKYTSKKRKEKNEWFFKTGKGEYGHGDVFIGVSVPDIRKVARMFLDLDYFEIQKVLNSKIHEERLVALVILVERFKKQEKREAGLPFERKRVYGLYIKNLKKGNINNWDLIDISTPNIIGEYLLEHKQEKKQGQKILDDLVHSKSLWQRRASVLATLPFIKRGDFKWTLKNAKILLADTHDLTHKAVGWMLREVWKKDNDVCEKFLIKNYKKIPRTTLRYAIERMEEKKRKRFLKGSF